MKTIILDIGDESADWIKQFSRPAIQKTKVYVKKYIELDMSPHDIQVLRYFERGKLDIMGVSGFQSSGLRESITNLKGLGLIEGSGNSYTLTNKGKKVLQRL